MRKVLTLFLTILAVYCSSQIKMNVSIVTHKCVFGECKIKVTLTNSSNFNYAIPLDTTSLRGFDGDLFWQDFQKSEKVEKNLCLELSIKDLKVKKRLRAITRTENIDLDSNNLDSLFGVYERENKEYQKRVEFWKSTNDIKNNKIAEENMYLNQHMLKFDAGEKVSFVVKFETSFKLDKSSIYSYYLVSPSTKYSFNLRLKVSNDIQSYFTTTQLNHYKKYKIFTGHIESNSLFFSFEKEQYIFTDY